MASFQLIRIVLLCSGQTTDVFCYWQHQCRCTGWMWWTCSNTFGKVHLHFMSVLVLIEQSVVCSWQSFNSLRCPLMPRTNCRCLQSLNISVNVTKYVENRFTNSPSSLTFCPLQKTTCPDWNNIFMARFQLIRMSTYAKNKLQMSSVTQHHV